MSRTQGTWGMEVEVALEEDLGKTRRKIRAREVARIA